MTLDMIPVQFLQWIRRFVEIYYEHMTELSANKFYTRFSTE